MRANLLEIATRAVTDSRAIPAFSVYDFTTAQAVIAGSEEVEKPVILLVPPKAASGKPGINFIRALRQLADRATVEACIQLDHATKLDVIRDSVDAGVDAVLADGSAYSITKNAQFVKNARLLIGPDIILEAEIGAISGDEDISRQQEVGEKTDPKDVAPFLAMSQANLLAVAVGNVHGSYQGVPALDWPLIDMIRNHASSVPLVLHGASGLPASDVAKAGSAGIGKVNFNTELRSVIFDYIKENSHIHMSDGMNMLSFLDGWSVCAQRFAAETHRRLAFSSTGNPALQI
ncbi:class II fructose-bisphosphate aldolase [Arthrobacter sp. H35-D1]|uniref:class II fructose-bisphosphate aldolase n=1 Tax=Arthrobacter sp. H35-D1 TaxID=3046202 RepID=UPI0024BAA45F|nr:class II fructose-bisphosphate aldolase [Arthrobacter sp. H35-D1]MDJ0312698.1 class II fructose-bisphosphate aldolase [Arthrobacter sp. H35-D1]